MAEDKRKGRKRRADKPPDSFVERLRRWAARNASEDADARFDPELGRAARTAWAAFSTRHYPVATFALSAAATLVRFYGVEYAFNLDASAAQYLVDTDALKEKLGLEQLEDAIFVALLGPPTPQRRKGGKDAASTPAGLLHAVFDRDLRRDMLVAAHRVGIDHTTVSLGMLLLLHGVLATKPSKVSEYLAHETPAVLTRTLRLIEQGRQQP